MPIALQDVRTIGIIGTGTIGASWAAWFLARGYDVVASDPAPEAERHLRETVEAAWPVLERLGVAPGADPGRLGFLDGPEAVAARADFVQENAPERLEIKRPLLDLIDATLPADRVIASSTSGLKAADLQAACPRHPERLVVGHPFNPPHLVPLVEVVGGAGAAPEVVDWALAFYAAAGKKAIRIEKEVVGHVANRLQAALYREAVSLVAEGVASVADIDTALSAGPGLRWALMGPHLTFHLGGGRGGMEHFLNQFGPVMEAWWDDMGTPRFDDALRRRLIEGVAEEAAGRSIEQLAADRDRRLLAVIEAAGLLPSQLSKKQVQEET